MKHLKTSPVKYLVNTVRFSAGLPVVMQRDVSYVDDLMYQLLIGR